MRRSLTVSFLVGACALAACGSLPPIDAAPSLPGEALTAAPDGGTQAPSTMPAEVVTAAPTTTTTTAPSTTTTSTTTTTRAPRRPITLGFGGDTALTHGLAERDPLGRVTEMLSAPDLTALNLETVVAESGVGTPLDKTYVFRSPPSTVGTLTRAGVDVVSLANNHSVDYGRDGILRTVELLDDGGVVNVGVGADPDEAYAAAVMPVGDWQVGFVGLNRVECGYVANDPTRWPEVAWTCPGFEDRARTAVEDAAARSDITVVMVHWGVELEHCPTGYQPDLAQQWIDAGADLVVGHHPHLLQGVQQRDGVWVLYSIGNFAFPSAREDRAYSAFFTFEVSEGPDGEPELAMRAQPIHISEGRPRPLDADSDAGTLATLSQRSFGWEFGADGQPQPREAAGKCG